MQVRRIVVRDRYPIFESEVYMRSLNRYVLVLAGLALAVQVQAWIEVAHRRGAGTAWTVHLSFAAVAMLWLLLGAVVFLQRRSGRAGQLFLASSAAGAMFVGTGTT